MIDIVSRAVDTTLELTIAGSFSSVGIRSRRRLERWPAIPRMAGRRVVLTGATSGIGRAAAQQFAELGADLTIVGRDPGRTLRTRDEINRAVGAERVTTALADIADLDRVRTLADELRSDPTPIDVLVHNAGAMTHEYTTSPQGFETTYAAQVLGPTLLTTLLLPNIADGGRVITVSSGGMYSWGLRPDSVEMRPDDYDGVQAYARAKRAQVELTKEWAVHHPSITFQAMHPGWADTPGVRDALPRFHRLTGPFLRTPEEGADTIVWLAASPEARSANGKFWLDRHARATERLPGTRSSPQERRDLWESVHRQIGQPAFN